MACAFRKPKKQSVESFAKPHPTPHTMSTSVAPASAPASVPASAPALPPFRPDYSHLRHLTTGQVIVGRRGEDKYLTTAYYEGVQLHPESCTATLFVRADGKHYRDTVQLETMRGLKNGDLDYKGQLVQKAGNRFDTKNQNLKNALNDPSWHVVVLVRICPKVHCVWGRAWLADSPRMWNDPSAPLTREALLEEVPRLKQNKPEYVEGVRANAQWTFPLLVRRVAGPVVGPVAVA